MLWSTLRILVNSKAYWSLNFLFFLVPFLSGIEFHIDYELFGLYTAAWLLLIAGLSFSMTMPEIIKYDDFSVFSKAGRDPRYLQKLFEDAKGVVGEIADDDLRTRFMYVSKDTADSAVFWYVFNHIDQTNRTWRRILTGIIFLAALLLLAVNLSRFTRVALDTFYPEKESIMQIANNPLPIGLHISVGQPTEVTHENGIGGTTQTTGDLIDSDDNGYVVIKEKGRLIYIPRGKIILIVVGKN